MVESGKRLKFVGEFVRQKRESLRLSQRSLGMLFVPPVSTQFISNVERGVTPLPPAHVPTLAKALKCSEQEIAVLLEKEYANKLNGRLGRASDLQGLPDSNGKVQSDNGIGVANIGVEAADLEFMRTLYEAYRNADPRAKQAFGTVCESILKVPKANIPS